MQDNIIIVTIKAVVVIIIMMIIPIMVEITAIIIPYKLIIGTNTK